MGQGPPLMTPNDLEGEVRHAIERRRVVVPEAPAHRKHLLQEPQRAGIVAGRLLERHGQVVCPRRGPGL